MTALAASSRTRTPKRLNALFSCLLFSCCFLVGRQSGARTSNTKLKVKEF